MRIVAKVIAFVGLGCLLPVGAYYFVDFASQKMASALSTTIFETAMKTSEILVNYNDSIILGVQKKIEKEYPGYTVKNIRYPTLGNGYKSFEFHLLKDGKVKGKVFVDEAGNMTTEGDFS
ncbi:hypothetical protein P4S91_27050 [Aneurinibacillus aneurinilyticus]|uniref:hypothetical protein n=1 Tax=Aneurinibacillus aneurinilyticus TaxID=1391 RepID=UPI002E21A935|nr:hypothetical protein [Aneurinibacillus aneurinilyticus]MED0726496.1 hypothetical protein [Aneurinibacillus aneurinilyticus]